MSTLLIKRAYRVLMLSMASILIASMLAPIVAVASTDLVAGDSAIVSNPEGAYLRTDTTVLDDTTISADLPQGSTVWIQENPVYNDTGVWVYVAADGYGPGWISTSMLTKVETDEVADPSEELATEDTVSEEPVADGLAWLEPIDGATVVDYNNVLTVEGLAVRDGIDGNLIGYAPVGTVLDVTSAREWVGDVNYVRVNFNGVGGYVHGDYVELTTEAVVEAPTEEVIWVEPTEVVTEEVPVETEVVTEVVPVETEVIAEEAVTEAAPAETEVIAEEAVTEAAPVETEVIAEEAVTEAAPVETEVVAEQVVTEVAPVETEVIAEEVAAETQLTSNAAPAETEVVTEEAASTPTEVVTEEVPVETEATAELAVNEEVATEAPTEAATEEATVAPTTVATEAPTEEVAEPVSIASTADKFNADAMIGSATVTGTQNGLLCRVSPDPASAVLMTLSEGTKVLVSAEATNGYLGIDCGGLQGFADVNYLWSGGAGDGEITAARMNVLVTGTGNGLNCRTGASLSDSVITTVFDGTTLVTRGAASNGWTPVICGGMNGFVSTTWIEPAAGSAGAASSAVASGSAKVTAGGDGLYCRTGAGTSYGVITVLRDGSSVAVRGAQQGEWVPVTCGGAAGFAHSAYLSVSATTGTSTDTPGTATGTATGNVTVANTGGQGLNCRSGAGTSNSVITVLSLGQTVQTRSGSTNGWTAVICGGTNGFVSSEFVSGGQASSAPTTPAPTAPAPVAPSGIASGSHVKTTDALNLRYSGNTSSSVSTVIPAGKVIKVTGALSNSFYPVDYDGLAGYVHSDYVVLTSEALSQRGGSATPTNPAPAPAPAPSTPSGSALVNYAMRYVGYPYVWATHGPASFDCSGFTYWVVQNVMGKNIGYGTWTQVSAGTPVSKADLQAGDLVFFQNTYTAGLSHVGLYIGNGQFIHAQNEETGVVISDLNSSYYGPRWYGAVRL